MSVALSDMVLLAVVGDDERSSESDHALASFYTRIIFLRSHEKMSYHDHGVRIFAMRHRRDFREH